MTGLSLLDCVARRYSERTLAAVAVVAVVCMVVTVAVVAWYFGSMGLSLRAMAYTGDDRTVVVDATDSAAFPAHYDTAHEVGWCLYGQANESHVRVEAVVPASTLAQRADEVRFTCLPETAGRAVSGRPGGFLGAVHSHPSYNRSFLSHKDVMLWGRTSPVVEVMGVYTEPGGVAFFTVESMAEPLDVRVVGRHNSTVARTNAPTPESVDLFTRRG